MCTCINRIIDQWLECSDSSAKIKILTKRRN